MEPANATDKAVTWSSSHPAIATVGESTGLVTAESAGAATITVTTADGNFTASVAVTVNPVVVTSVTINEAAQELEIGGTFTFTATVEPANATNKAVTWSSNDENVATVGESTGEVEAKAAGAATITVTTVDGNFTASVAVTVNPLLAPTGLQHGQLRQKNATLSWNSVEGADSYEIDLDGTPYTAAASQIVLNDLTPDTHYTWKVRAKKANIYSEWSDTDEFQTQKSLSQTIFGTWNAADVQLNFRANDYLASYDGLLNRSHTTRPVTVVIANNNDVLSIVSVSGMDAHIAGNVAQDDFSIDSQLAGLQFTLTGQEDTIVISPDITASNICKQSPNISIGSIPDYKILFGDFATLIANSKLQEIDFTVTKVYLIGTLDSQGNPVFRFTYDIDITRVKHNISSWILGMAGIDGNKLHEQIAKPQQIISEEVVVQ